MGSRRGNQTATRERMVWEKAPRSISELDSNQGRGSGLVYDHVCGTPIDDSVVEVLLIDVCVITSVN